MSTGTLVMSNAALHAWTRLIEAVAVPFRASRPAQVAPGAQAAQALPAAGPHLSWLDRVDRWFDGMTDDRAELERYLARAQNITDLENRMRDALQPEAPLRF